MASGDMREKPPTNFPVKEDQFPEPSTTEFDPNVGEFGEFVEVPPPPRAVNVSPATRNITEKPEVNFGHTLAHKNMEMTRMRQMRQGHLTQKDVAQAQQGDRINGKYYTDVGLNIRTV